MSIPSDKLRELVNSVVTTVESRGLFVHSTDLDIKYNDGNKKVSGRKRHILVDTLGNLLDVAVTVANLHDTKGANQLLNKVEEICRTL